MAEQESQTGEKEFEASEQKRLEARREGNVAQSKEANGFALVLGIFCAAMVLRSVVGSGLFADFSAVLYHSDAIGEDIFESGGSEARGLLLTTMIRFLPIFVVLVVFVLGALVLQRSITFSMKKIQIDMKKISPQENISKRYGPKGLLDFLKDMAKMLFAGAIAAVFLAQFAQAYYNSTAVQRGQFTAFTFEQVMNLIVCFCIFQFVLAAIDLPLQRQLHAGKLRMTREEMKKEMKQNEGDPMLKQQRREKGQKISRGEMLQNVKTATVIMVNPEHYAVALKWDPNGETAPICVAKGIDHLAARIREIAMAHDVPIYRDPPAARSLYRLVEVDEEIKKEHFAAVAAAIQYVDRIRGSTSST